MSLEDDDPMETTRVISGGDPTQASGPTHVANANGPTPPTAAPPSGRTPAPPSIKAPSSGPSRSSEAPRVSDSAKGGDVAVADAVEPVERTRKRPGWLWVALPITGLMLVPTIGLLYAATTTFGVGEPATADSATPADGDEDGAPTPGAKTKGGASKKVSKSGKTLKPTKSAGHTAGRPRSDEASLCCTKLRELGKTAEIAERAPYLSAASSCEAASDAEIAWKRVKSQLAVAKLELPPECDH